MTQSDMENCLYEVARSFDNNHITRRQARELVVALFGAMADAINEGDRVRMPRIGTLVKRQPRKVAPNSLPTVKGAAKSRPTVKFVVSDTLRDELRPI